MKRRRLCDAPSYNPQLSLTGVASSQRAEVKRHGNYVRDLELDTTTGTVGAIESTLLCQLDLCLVYDHRVFYDILMLL